MQEESQNPSTQLRPPRPSRTSALSPTSTFCVQLQAITPICLAVTQLSTLFSLRSSLYVLEKDKASLHPSASSSCTSNTQLLRNCCHCKCIQTAHTAEQKLFPIQMETKVISSLQNQIKYKHTGTVGGTGTGSTSRCCIVP